VASARVSAPEREDWGGRSHHWRGPQSEKVTGGKTSSFLPSSWEKEKLAVALGVAGKKKKKDAGSPNACPFPNRKEKGLTSREGRKRDRHYDRSPTKRKTSCNSNVAHEEEGGAHTHRGGRPEGRGRLNLEENLLP